MAWVYREKGDLRRAINAMRRAYPQHLAAGGEGLPPEILQVIFPLTYWDSIRRLSAAHDLDPYSPRRSSRRNPRSIPRPIRPRMRGG